MESVARNRAGKRLMWFGGAILLWGALILIQLFRLQVVHHSDYVRAAHKQQEETLEIAAPRGSIFDRSGLDRKSTRLNSSHLVISYAVFCLKKHQEFNKADPIWLSLCGRLGSDVRGVLRLEPLSGPGFLFF